MSLVMRPIPELNHLSSGAFAEGLRALFEAAGPLSDALYALRPFTSYAALIDQAEAVATDLPEPQQMEILNAHPRIGENAQRVSVLSFREQGYAAEAGLDPVALERVYVDLAQLNETYEQTYGFRFVVFVNKRSKAEVLEELRGRLANSRTDELATGLRNLFLIARDRLATLGYDADMYSDSNAAARQALLDKLSRSALETYGSERCAEATLQNALRAAAGAVWRVSQEPLEPLGNEPLPTHG
jgi:2-oxo-4-hydroxy-4-carboxy--5-ureidoimidazoline (OHCU) decarboxylase